MLQHTRLLFNSMVGKIITNNGLDASYGAVPGQVAAFTVNPVVEQQLQAKLVVSSDFMSRINVVPVVAQQGARVGVGIGRSLASRTNTAGGTPRNPTNPTASDAIDQYFCKKTDYDYSIPYSQLDAWAHRPEFMTLVTGAIVAQRASDVITIGFNGLNAAVTTDRATYPLLQDVNYGWIYKIKTYAPARVMSHGDLDNVKVYVSETGASDYENLDALVFDARHNLLHESWRGRTDLVVIVGSDLVHEKYFRIISAAGDKATEQVARDVILGSRQIGGLQPVQVPFFPANAILITTLKNLSYYWQMGTARRHVVDYPKLDQIENYESINDAFMVEEYGGVGLVENIQLAPKP